MCAFSVHRNPVSPATERGTRYVVGAGPRSSPSTESKSTQFMGPRSMRERPTRC